MWMLHRNTIYAEPEEFQDLCRIHSRLISVAILCNCINSLPDAVVIS